MKIVWFSWKDRSHPLAGGAETVSGEIMDRLVAAGHEIYHITSRSEGAKDEEETNGIHILRAGNKYSVYSAAKRLYKSRLADWPDLVIDEMNTIPFFSAFYTNKPNILLSYQLARSVWFYQMIFPLSLVGYLVEPLYLRLLSQKYRTVATESESSRHDIAKYGFKLDSIKTFRVGMSLEPLSTLQKKDSLHTVLSLGSIRPMKRTLEAVKAFEFARDADRQISLVIAGDKTGTYAQKVMQYVAHSRHREAISLLGKVTNDERLKLMKEAGVILVTSIKEGWGLIVTEANSQGTPAIVYDVDGLRDSVIADKTGVLCKSGDYISMGMAINDLLSSRDYYEQLRTNAWKWSREFTFKNSFEDFLQIITEVKKT